MDDLLKEGFMLLELYEELEKYKKQLEGKLLEEGDKNDDE